MGVTIAQLWRTPGFHLGLAIRVLAIALVFPYVQEIWFVPFMQHAIQAPAFDPWADFLHMGGDTMSFPYGIVMFLAHAPFVALGMLGAWLTGAPAFTQTGFAVSLLAADFMLLLALCRMNRNHIDNLVSFYWLSPLVLYISFWHGQTDVIPTLFIVSALVLIRERRFKLAGAVYGFALAAKLSAVIPLPFVLLFLWKNRRYRDGLLQFFMAGLAVALITQLPPLMSGGYRSMVLGSPEIAHVYDVAISLSAGISIYIVPLLYLLLLFWAWQIGRMNFEMLFAFLGVSYFLILLATPAAVGWYLWVMPFLAAFQIVSGRGPQLLIAAFSVAFIAVKLLTATGASVPLLGLDFRAPLIEVLAARLPERTISLIMSGLAAAGLVICVTLVQRALRNNDFFRLSRRPLFLGIAGDSGTGKDTLSAALAGLFGERSIASVSGDDYHRFERFSPMWRSLTHLDPRANDLNGFSRDCIALVEGRHIRCRHYDHKTGLFTRRELRSANDVVLVSGLHALYQENLLARMDLRIFLGMDETLRQFLKMRRDVVARGHSREAVQTSIDRRLPDYERFLAPQMARADVVFSLEAAAPEMLTDIAYDGPVPLRLRVRLRSIMRSDELQRVLSALCGIQAEILPSAHANTIELLVEGDELSCDDVKSSAFLLVPHIEELLDVEPQWQSGMTGVMQVIVLMLIAESATSRT